ncbi:MAG TPA: hypothetical protein VHN82_01540 [Methanoregula sp.]|nr:hypothetical protein [Methanoregula sp.]
MKNIVRIIISAIPVPGSGTVRQTKSPEKFRHEGPAVTWCGESGCDRPGIRHVRH